MDWCLCIALLKDFLLMGFAMNFMIDIITDSYSLSPSLPLRVHVSLSPS